MDVHAHLASSEVIGLLGGTWEPDGRRIHVVRAFPCRRALGTHSGTSVELDPAAEVETRALMEAHSLTPVGWWGPAHLSPSDCSCSALSWVLLCGGPSRGRCQVKSSEPYERMCACIHARYHSHPVFAPKPSQKDAENQRNYQALFRCDASSLEPFLGAIVGPYDVQLPSPVSSLTPFNIAPLEDSTCKGTTTSKLSGCGAGLLHDMVLGAHLAKGLSPRTMSVSATAAGPLARMRQSWVALHSLINMVRDDDTRIDFSETWRPFTSITDGQYQGPPMRKVLPWFPLYAEGTGMDSDTTDANKQLHAARSLRSSKLH